MISGKATRDDRLLQSCSILGMFSNIKASKVVGFCGSIHTSSRGKTFDHGVKENSCHRI